MTPSELDNFDRPTETSRNRDARARKTKEVGSNVERGEIATSWHGRDIGQMLVEFRRQDRATTATLVGAFLTLFATFAVWSWYFSHELATHGDPTASISDINTPKIGDKD
jgi:hypothetical protein